MPSSAGQPPRVLRPQRAVLDPGHGRRGRSSARTRPSAVSRSNSRRSRAQRELDQRHAGGPPGRARRCRPWPAAGRTGPCPSGSTATKVCVTNFWSSLERPQRGLLPGRVAVEGEDHLAARTRPSPSAAGAGPRCARRRTRCRRSPPRSARRPGGRPSRRCSPRRRPPAGAGRSPSSPCRRRRAPATSCRAGSPGC